MSTGRKDTEGGTGGPDENSILRSLALATELGVTMGVMTVATVLAGLFLGSWLDRQLGTRPLATLLFILLGVLAGSLGTVNLARSTIRRLNSAAAEQVRARTAYRVHDLGRAMLLVLELSLVTLAPVGLALWLGLLLDRATGARPLFTVLLATVSTIGALVGVLVISMRAARRDRHDSQEAS